MRDRLRRRLLVFQSVYYLATGLWPLIHLRSFEAVSGPKTDDWLVHTVGLLAVAIGAALGVAAAHDRVRAPETLTLAAGAALAFATIDFWYGLNGHISPVYLADGVLELALLTGMALTRRTTDA
jgi:hypothetical protein